jgi:hypothetical protein
LDVWRREIFEKKELRFGIRQTSAERSETDFNTNDVQKVTATNPRRAPQTPHETNSRSYSNFSRPHSRDHRQHRVNRLRKTGA